MIAAVLKESLPGERRVALIPKDAAALKAKGVDVRVEAGAGAEALHADADYEAVGATVEAGRERLLAAADLLLTVRGIGDSEAGRLRPGAAVLGFLDPLDEPERMSRLGAKGVALLAMELVPRITRAQGMDALSSMASLQGRSRRGRLRSARECSHDDDPPPGRSLRQGLRARAGVAGLQAIAHARRLGAVVEGYDVRSRSRNRLKAWERNSSSWTSTSKKRKGREGYAAAQSTRVLPQAAGGFRAASRGRGPDYHHGRGARQKSPVVDYRGDDGRTPARHGHRRPRRRARRQLRRRRRRRSRAAQRRDDSGAGERSRRRSPRTPARCIPGTWPNFVDILIRDGALHLDMEDEIVRGALVARGGEVVHERVAELLAAPRTQEA